MDPWYMSAGRNHLIVVMMGMGAGGGWWGVRGFEKVSRYRPLCNVSRLFKQATVLEH
jgi:hypothetical protein